MESSKENEKEKEFVCASCKFKMKYHYYGQKPPFLKSLMLLEDAYILKDPFSTEGGLITIGAHCSLCTRPVCISNDCSLFFSKRFCLSCVVDHIEEFPVEIQQLPCPAQATMTNLLKILMHNVCKIMKYLVEMYRGKNESVDNGVKPDQLQLDGSAPSSYEEGAEPALKYFVQEKTQSREDVLRELYKRKALFQMT